MSHESFASDSAGRRRFLSQCGLLATGAAGGWLWSERSRRDDAVVAADAKADRPSPEGRVKELGLTLPVLAESTNTFVPTVRVGELLFVAGHVPGPVDGKLLLGKVGGDLTIEQGRAAARNVGLIVLARLRQSLGSLDRVVRLVRTLGMVNATPDFTQQPQVINAFSDLLVEVFGPEAGKGTRCAVGMGSLPGGHAVELETVWQVR